MKYEWEAGGVWERVGDPRAPGFNDSALDMATRRKRSELALLRRYGRRDADDCGGPLSP
jgi:hypothetical protein